MDDKQSENENGPDASGATKPADARGIDWSDPSIPVGDAPPMSVTPLALSWVVWLVWLVFLVTMAVSHDGAL